MSNLRKITKKILTKLEKKDRVREASLKASRDIIRLCSDAIQKMHLKKNVDKLILSARSEAEKLVRSLKSEPDLYYSGFVENALQELCEACIIYAVLKKEDLPDPDELRVTYTSYLLGLSDAIGELRRFALDSLLEDRLEQAKHYLELMELFYSTLMKFEFPTAIVAIRKKQDLARSLLERTRAELVLATREKSLEKKLEELKL